MKSASYLLGQSIEAWGKQSAVEGTAQRGHPLEMEMVKDPRIDARPVMNRHGYTLRRNTAEMRNAALVFSSFPGQRRRENTRAALLAAFQIRPASLPAAGSP